MTIDKTKAYCAKNIASLARSFFTKMAEIETRLGIRAISS